MSIVCRIIITYIIELLILYSNSSSKKNKKLLGKDGVIIQELNDINFLLFIWPYILITKIIWNNFINYNYEHLLPHTKFWLNFIKSHVNTMLKIQGSKYLLWDKCLKNMYACD